ncbi:MAG TPA: PaaI family thioesterase [Actinomycetota bacterium]|nr:PaaI family thioesterase [Actinomycetota bacterium]
MSGQDRSPGDQRALDQKALETLRRHVESSAFHAWAGFELVSVEVGIVEMALDLEPHHLNPGGILHGGMVATLADTAIGLAVRSALPPDRTHVTAQLNVHFLEKVGGGRVRALGRAVRVGGRMGYGEGDVVDEDGRLVARASGTFIVLPA